MYAHTGTVYKHSLKLGTLVRYVIYQITVFSISYRVKWAILLNLNEELKKCSFTIYVSDFIHLDTCIFVECLSKMYLLHFMVVLSLISMF